MGLQVNQHHLERVSRSFAFCIAELDPPLQGWVGNAYLLCRIADTIEDSSWGDRALQLEAFDRFLEFFDLPEAELTRNVTEWVATFPSDVPPAEQELLGDTDRLLVELRGMPFEVQARIRETIENMVRGMRHFVERSECGIQLQTLSETNGYCFFVAGVVGELLTHLQKIFLKESNPVGGEVLRDAYHFGLFLQKVNLLKDEMEDLKVGRSLVSDRNGLLQSMRVHAERAFEYLVNIPDGARSFRLFCAWSLFMGLKILPLIKTKLGHAKKKRVSRIVMWRFLRHIRSQVDDLELLRKTFLEMLSVFEPHGEVDAIRPRSSQAPCYWSLYRGAFTWPQAQELGLQPRSEIRNGDKNHQGDRTFKAHS